MVKLFLAEDEIAMREGIKKHIDWASEGIDFCGEAADGELALPQILEKRPDIVITDIKMPFMDGLQLSALIRKELPGTKIVILSGYSEFEYAQEALRLGVTEYLLKPVTPRKLKEVIRKLAVSVEEEKRQQEERIDLMLEEQREKDEHVRRKLFRSLISGEMTTHEMLGLAESIDLRLGVPFYQLILVYVGYKSDYSRQEFVENRIKSIADGIDGCYVFEHSVDSEALLLTGRTEAELSEKREKVLKETALAISSTENLRYFISAGKTVSHLREIREAYREAYRAASYRFFISQDQIVTSDMPVREQLSINNNNYMPVNTDQALQKGDLRNIWESFLRTGTLQETETFVEDIFSSIGEENVQSLMFLNYLTMDCYFTMARFVRDLGGDPEEISRRTGDINSVMGTLKTAEDSREFLTEYLQEVIRQRDGRSSGRNNPAVRTAVAFIDEHFTDGELSLNTVAQEAGLSPNRFSALFSHEMGMTFMEYLIGKRMDLACTLLMTTDLRSSEIAYQSGYNDPHYFSATFKKIKGMSPREYRRRGQGTDYVGER